MRTVAEHLAACLEIARPAAPLDVVLLDAVGCVLAEDVVADIDLPSADLAGLDGYAVMSAAVAEANEATPVSLEVMDAVRAGDVRPTRLVPGAAVLIDSGAPLPLGADAVVPWMLTDRGQSRVQGSCPTETYAATLLAPPRASRARSVNALHTELCPCPL